MITVIVTRPKPILTTVHMQHNIAIGRARDQARTAEAYRAPSNGVHGVIAFDRIHSSSVKVRFQVKAGVRAQSEK